MVRIANYIKYNCNNYNNNVILQNYTACKMWAYIDPILWKKLTRPLIIAILNYHCTVV